jgi:FAD/FMN-containing dehydrogenase
VTLRSAVLDSFAALLGPKGMSTDSDRIAPLLTDWRGLYHGRSDAVLMPSTTAEVQGIVRLAAQYKVALVPQGGNTSMVGGATPPADGSALIVSMIRMNAIRSLDPSAQTVIAEAGVVLQSLHDASGEHGLRFPLTLGAKGSATIGGLVSTNAGGTQVLRFGTMRKLVLGVEAVLPDGSLHTGLAALKKDTRGYDLDQLLIGAEGTLGIVTAAMLRLVAQPVDLATGWAGVDSPQAALALLRWLEARSGEAIESFELMPDHSIRAVLDHIPGTRSPLEGAHRWHVLVDHAGKGARHALEILLGEALEAGLVADAAVAASVAQSEAFWRLRDSISAAERALGPAIQHDISVPVDAMPDFMIETAKAVEAAFPGVQASGYGHLGDGNVHFHVRAPEMPTDAVQAWREGEGHSASMLVYEAVVAAGGSISAEHGIGQMKRAALGRLSDPSRIMALRAIKAALDPLGIMNPGKLVPLASETVAQ